MAWRPGVLHSMLAVIFVVALFGAGFGSGSVHAYDPAGSPLPDGATAAATFQWIDEKWVPAVDAVSYNSGSDAGACGRRCWDVGIENNVSVAQWLDWEIFGLRTDWRVLKPGTYTGQMVRAHVRSNNAIHFHVWMNDASSMAPDAPSSDIAQSFSITASDSLLEAQTYGWRRAVDHPASDPHLLVIPDGERLRNGLDVNVWHQIEVTADHRSAEYYADGGVLICLTNMKHWIDAEQGGLDPAYNPVSSLL